jgi:hypothetical protein
LRTVTLVLLLSCAALASCRLSRDPAATPEEDPELRCRNDGDPLPSECPKETRPVTSAVAAVCIASKVIPVDRESDCGFRYSVTFRDSRWFVRIFDSTATVRNGAFLIQVEPKSGRITKIQAAQ